MIHLPSADIIHFGGEYKVATKWKSPERITDHTSRLSTIFQYHFKELNCIIIFSDNTICIVSHFTIYIIFLSN